MQTSFQYYTIVAHIYVAHANLDCNNNYINFINCQINNVMIIKHHYVQQCTLMTMDLSLQIYFQEKT